MGSQKEGIPLPWGQSQEGSEFGIEQALGSVNTGSQQCLVKSAQGDGWFLDLSDQPVSRGTKFK